MMDKQLSEIRTGVDKLVELVKKKEEITVSAASKELNLSKEVILDWASLLEEENLIQIEYKLSKTILRSKHHHAKSNKQKKHTIFGKVKDMLTSVTAKEKELTVFKKDLNKFKCIVDEDMTELKKELDELSGSEKDELKLSEKIHKKRLDFKKNMLTLNSKLITEQKRYNYLLKEILEEQHKLEKEQKEVLSIKEQEVVLMKNIESMNRMINKISNEIENKDKNIRITEKHLISIRKLAERTRDEIKKDKDEIDSLLKESRIQKTTLEKAEKDILEKIKKTKASKNKTKVAKQLKELFAKKKEIKKLIDSIEHDRIFLEDHLRDLVKEATAHKDKTHLDNLQKELSKINRKKKDFKEEILKLHKIFS